MTKKQLTAAKRQVTLLERIRKNLENCNTAGCFNLEDVNRQALESNADCLSILRERIRLEKEVFANAPTPVR